MKTKINSAKDILNEEELQKYSEGWKNFKGKYKLNSSYNTYSGLPVISLVYQFEDKPLFRAHVFRKKLRSYDPYHITEKCLQPFWHAQHYIIVGEQIYTAASKIIIGNKYNEMIAKDVPIEFKWTKPLFWDDNISVELIREEDGKVGEYEKQIGDFTIYSDKTKRRISQMSAASFWQTRSYIQSIEVLKEGNEEALEKLIRQIEAQDINQKRLIKPRINLPEKAYLISELRAGSIPEEELHNFFSFWDKP